MRASLLAVVLLSGLTAGCKSELKDAQKLVASKLKDPGSAQFRNVRKGTYGRICGEVNGKNSYGGYTGFSNFSVNGSIVLMDDDLPYGEWTVYCGMAEVYKNDPEGRAKLLKMDADRLR